MTPLSDSVNHAWVLAGQNLIRIAAVAIGLSTLSFAAGVAGDLSILDQPQSGQSVVVRIPPEIPSDAPRARPLLSTASAVAAPVRRARRAQAEMPGEVSRLVESVQVAHEAEFEPTVIVFAVASLQQLKPQAQNPVKPSPDALAAPRETKVA